VNRVIEAASTKPYGFTKFSPSIGAGGHCIPVDPVYLLKKSIEVNTPIKSIDVALKINNEMPLYFVDKAEEILVKILNKRILVIGLAYKPNISDLRESSSLSLISGLRKRGAKVFWHDDLVKEWNSEESVPISGDFDLAILATPHNYIDLTKLGSVPILNTRGSV
jgi:UDP-N-acetyl-D-glucosamine dehydrogenase